MRNFTRFRSAGMPKALTDLRPAKSLDDFRNTAGVVDYGPLIQAAVLASFTDAQGRSLPLWNIQPGEDLTAAGLVLQKRHDLHPRYGTHDLATTERGNVPGRVGERPLQHLRGAKQYVDLKIERSLVLSPFHHVRVIWSRHGIPVLSCTWPVFFTT
jgi:hypothetical protein